MPVDIDEDFMLAAATPRGKIAALRVPYYFE